MKNNTHKQRIEEYLSSKTELPKIIVVYGPTACWKTALSIEIAQFLNSEIISTDSRQIYRYMDIGTGKVTKEEMSGIPHHMIDVIDPTDIYSVVDFTKMALPKIQEIQKIGKIPILCGGTGLYIDGVLYDMPYPDTPPDWEYRESLEKIRQEQWNQELWDMLNAVDPEYARTLEVWNYRYIMRWLEVIKKTGESKWNSIWKKIPRFSPLFITPYTDSVENRALLYKNINQRVENMFINWLIDEVWYNIDNFWTDCTGLTTIWYREIVDSINGKITMDEAKSLIQQRSRNYAKRQITWNKKYEQY